jgi:glycosyltransferase involved in cell wall biosynthesis
MENKEKVHIGLPVFNGERYLAQSLASLLNQTHENFRLFIVDNVSTDGTQDIARAYAKKDKRVEYIRQTEWGSWSVNWSRTWEIAAPGCEFFMWASDDDLWAPGYIETLLPPLVMQPRNVLSFSQSDSIDGEGRVIARLYRDSRPKGKTCLGRIQSLIHSTGYSAIYGLLRTSAVTHEPAFPEVSFGADLWFLIQLACQGTFHFKEEVLFFKRNFQPVKIPALSLIQI